MYITRFRVRQSEREKRYDDIFSSVVRKVCSQRNEDFNVKNVDAAKKKNNEPAEKPKVDSVLIILEKRSVKTTGGSSSSKDNSENVETSSIEDKCDPKGEFVCTRCEGVAFRRHMQLHEHIVMKHGYEKAYSCSRCHVPARCLRHNNLCKTCGRFVIRMREHECEAARVACYAVALADQERARCPKCPGTFASLHELRRHMRTDCVGHGTAPKRAKNKTNSLVSGFIARGGTSTTAAQTRTRPYRCSICTTRFYTRHAKDQHLMEHFGGTIDEIFDALLKMQQHRNDPWMVNQCPLCDGVMGSRKSFRLHVVHKHLLPHGDALKKMLCDAKIKTEEEPAKDEGVDFFMSGEIALVEELAAVKEEEQSCSSSSSSYSRSSSSENSNMSID